MPPYTTANNWIREALSAWPEYMFGGPGVLESVTANELSVPVCLAPTSEGHGVRGFVVTIIWPAATTAGVVEVQGADLNDNQSYAPLGTITFPAIQYTSPSGLVVNFMRLRVATLPTPTAQLAGRLMIR